MLTHLIDLLRLPAQALLRRRGGKRSNSSLNSNLRAILDQKRALESQPDPDLEVDRPRDPDSTRVARATALASAGYVSRAARTLLQGDLKAHSAEVSASLRQLHPVSSGQPPRLPESVMHVGVDQDALKKLITKKLKNGSSAGPSGWTGELVAPLVSDRECLHVLGVLVGDIINGTLDVACLSLDRKQVAESGRSRYPSVYISWPRCMR